MIFTNVRSQNSYIGNKIQQSRNMHSSANANIFSIIKSNNNRSIISVPPKPIIKEEPKPSAKMKWGQPTWYVLHCLAEKVKEEAFPSIRQELLNIIYMICANLPCPDCATHASEYLKTINYKMIQTKEQLKNMLYSFHNTVNAKKNMPIFPRDELEIKYKNMDFISTVYTFMGHFQDKHKSVRMIANDFYRSRIAEQIKIWLKNNLINFNL